MAGLTVIITTRGILVAEGGAASVALLQRFQSAIATGEAQAVVVNRANTGAPIVEGFADAQALTGLQQAALAQNANQVVRNSFGAVVGTLTALGTMELGPANALAIALGVEQAFLMAYDEASNWSSAQDWPAIFGALENARRTLSDSPIYFDPLLDPRDVRVRGLTYLDFVGTANWPEAFYASQEAISPLALDLDGDGLETLGVASGAYFDHDGNGFAESTGWVATDDALLVRDLNNDGHIVGGVELFGDQTLLVSGQKAANGYQALAELDVNSDGKVDSLDSAWSSLLVWKDANADGVSTPDELIALGDAGVVSINTAYSMSNYVDANGNEHRQISSFVKSDGSTGVTTDVWFRTDKMLTIAEEWVAVPSDMAALPNARGFGSVYDLHQAMARDSSGDLEALVESFLALPTSTAREATLESLLFEWTGVASIAIDARGPYIDARKVAVLERFMGDTWQRPWDPAGSNLPIEDGAAIVIEQAFVQLKDQVGAQLRAQSELSDLFDLVSYTWDVQQGRIVADLAALQAQLESETSQGDGVGLLHTSEFIRTAKSLGTFDLEALRSNPLLERFIDGAPIYASTFGTTSAESVAGGAGSDLLVGLNGNDIITDTGGTTAVDAGDGDDQVTLSGIQSNAVVLGGLGNDTIAISGGTHFVDAGVGDDTVTLSGTQIDSIVVGGAGNDTLSGGGSNVALYGGDGSDNLNGWGTDVLLDGGAGDDVIWAEPSNPNNVSSTLIGGLGNDQLNGGQESTVYLFDRGDGQDTVWDQSWNETTTDTIVFGVGIAPGDVQVTRDATKVYLTLSENGVPTGDRVAISNAYQIQSRIEEVRFADGTVWTWDQLAAMAANMVGTAGDDTLVGYSENNTITALGGNDTISDSGGVNTIEAGDGNDQVTLSGNQAGTVVYGGAGADSLFGHAADITAYGDAGNDTLRVGAGSVAHGGDGDDMLIGSGSSGTSIAMTGGVGNDYFIGNGENATYNFGRGDGLDSIEEWGAGDTDRIVFGAGIGTGDVMVTGNGNHVYLDLLDGGAATGDRITILTALSYAERRVEEYQFADGTAWTWSQVQAMATAINGTAGDDTLSGGSANNIINGFAGNDTISDSGGANTINAGDGNDQVTLSGSQTGTVVYGGAGVDSLFGYSAGITAYGEAGNDTLRVGAGSAAYGGDGDDMLIGSGGSGASTTMTGGTGNDYFIGNSESASYYFNRGDGQDSIEEWGTGDADRIVLGAGIGTGDVQVTRSGNHVLFSLLDAGNATTDSIKAFNSFVYSEAQVEQVQFADGTAWTWSQIASMATTQSGTSGSDTLSGGTTGELLHGAGGGDTLNGNDGDDVVFGDAGADQVNGGAGNDYLSGGSDADALTGGDGNDVAQGGSGNDDVAGDAGNDLLDGGAGDDTLNGGAGNDFIAGGAGSDTIYTGDGNNVIAFGAGDGSDTVFGAAGAQNVISLGAGIDYSDLSLAKVGDDLVLSAGGQDSMTFKDWYADAENQTVLKLQMILDAMGDYDPNSSDPLENERVQTFDFLGLVSEFDQARASDPGLTSWALTNALLEFHLSGSDTEAIGGDLAYYHGLNGGLAQTGTSSLQQSLGAAGFGSDAQTMRPFTGLQEGMVRLS